MELEWIYKECYYALSGDMDFTAMMAQVDEEKVSFISLSAPVSNVDLEDVADLGRST